MHKNPFNFDCLSLAVLLALSIFATVLLRNAWLTEDAYITFRTADNFINGFGLTWNIDERVQTYTHPLWLILVITAYKISGEIYHTVIALAVGVSILAVGIFAIRQADSRKIAIIGIATLLLSKAFVDYSTSGLENPLTNLLAVLFYLTYLKYPKSPGRLFTLALLMALATLNRMDTVLLAAPALLYVFVCEHRCRGKAVVLAGMVPCLLWLMFAIAYYGFPFPNTAYAKLQTNVSQISLLKQGCYYFANSLSRDPVTLAVIFVSVLLVAMRKRKITVPLVTGILLYLFYIVMIGGDFMSGRFLSAPFFCAVMLIMHDQKEKKIPLVPILLLILLLGYAVPATPIYSGADYGLGQKIYGDLIDDHGIADERGIYYQELGWLKVRWGRKPDFSGWTSMGERLRGQGRSVLVAENIGLLGFAAGPQVHIVDYPALVDPLLARVPCLISDEWRIGHFNRGIPEGYIETLIAGENRIVDDALATYYDKLALVTRGPLFSGERWYAIWEINVGRYEHLLIKYQNPK